MAAFVWALNGMWKSRKSVNKDQAHIKADGESICDFDSNIWHVSRRCVFTCKYISLPQRLISSKLPYFVFLFLLCDFLTISVLLCFASALAYDKQLSVGCPKKNSAT